MQLKGKYIIVDSIRVRLLFKCTSGVLRKKTYHFVVKGLIYHYNRDSDYIGKETEISLAKDKKDWRMVSENEFHIELL